MIIPHLPIMLPQPCSPSSAFLLSLTAACLLWQSLRLIAQRWLAPCLYSTNNGIINVQPSRTKSHITSWSSDIWTELSLATLACIPHISIYCGRALNHGHASIIPPFLSLTPSKCCYVL